MSISPPIHTDDLDTLPDNTELIEILTARYDTGVLLRYGTDGTLKNTANPDAASTTAPTDVADIKPVVPETCTSQAYDTYKLESDLTLDWRHTHTTGNLAPIALHE